MTPPFTETGALGSLGGLLAAPLIGFGFGWFLERGGLGHAPKLAGQFYLTDLTVFKVMFSALVTAMLGAFWLDQFGLLKLDLVYLPETFVMPQAVGGGLFGAGFIVAGLCPGHVLRRSRHRPARWCRGHRRHDARRRRLQRDIRTHRRVLHQYALGAVTFTDLLGVSRGAGVAMVTAAALAGFALAARIERVRRGERVQP